MIFLQKLLLRSYSLLLHCYPRTFVDMFADEMLITFQHLLTEAIRKGYPCLILFVFREFIGLFIGVTQEIMMTSLFSQRIKVAVWACIICLLLAISTTMSSWFPVVSSSTDMMNILWMATGISLVGLLYLPLSFRYGTIPAVLAVVLLGLPVMTVVLHALWLSYVVPLLVLLGLLLRTVLEAKDRYRV